jgi:hypothetical protein
MKNGVSRDVTAVALVRTDASEELRASIIRVTRIGEPRYEDRAHRLLVRLTLFLIR